MLVLSGLCVTLFFGGWDGPIGDSYGPLWFLLKVFIIVCIFIWLRASLPRLRYDQLMNLGWKVLLPLATITAVVPPARVSALCRAPRSAPSGSSASRLSRPPRTR